MNNIINKFLLTCGKFMLKMYLKQPGFTYSDCWSYTKHRERFQTFRETGNLKHLYKNELGKAYFAHGVTYYDSKDLAKITISDKILKDKVYEIDRNRNHDGFQRALACMNYTFFDKKWGSGISVNEQPAKKLHIPVIEKF